MPFTHEQRARLADVGYTDHDCDVAENTARWHRITMDRQFDDMIAEAKAKETAAADLAGRLDRGEGAKPTGLVFDPSSRPGFATPENKGTKDDPFGVRGNSPELTILARSRGFFRDHAGTPRDDLGRPMLVDMDPKDKGDPVPSWWLANNPEPGGTA